MSDIQKVTNDIIFYLKENLLEEDIDFDSGFVFKSRNLYPNKVIVTGKIGKAKILDSGIGNCVGNNLFGKTLELGLDFCIYCGRGKSANNCEKVFSKIIEALMLRDNGLYIKEINSDKVSYLREAQALCMPFRVSIDYYITKENKTIPVSDFLLRSENIKW